MYFNNEKEDTNIDKEFSNKKKINFKNIDFKNFDFGKFKIPLFILGGIILRFVILLIVRPKGDKVEYFIKLEGGEDITVYKGEEFIDPGYYGYDTNGKDYTDKISIDSSVDSNKIGDYEVIYKLNDVSTPIAIIGTTIEGKQIAVNKTQISDIMSYGEGVGLSDDKFRREPPRLATEPLTQPR